MEEAQTHTSHHKDRGLIKEFVEIQESVVTGLAKPSTTTVHVTALDGLVSANSLFTVAVFVGLSLTTPSQKSLSSRAECQPQTADSARLLVFEVLSFSCFLFSSLIAQGLKLAINVINSKDAENADKARINHTLLRLGMLGSATGSVLGSVFLVVSMVNVIQIRLGLLSCGEIETVKAVSTLITLVSVALLGFISTIIYAFLS